MEIKNKKNKRRTDEVWGRGVQVGRDRKEKKENVVKEKRKRRFFFFFLIKCVLVRCNLSCKKAEKLKQQLTICDSYRYSRVKYKQIKTENYAAASYDSQPDFYLEFLVRAANSL